jgi:hypothetical protein
MATKFNKAYLYALRLQNIGLFFFAVAAAVFIYHYLYVTKIIYVPEETIWANDLIIYITGITLLLVSTVFTGAGLFESQDKTIVIPFVTCLITSLIAVVIAVFFFAILSNTLI